MFLIPLLLSHSCVVFCDISFPFWLSLPVYIEYSVANFRTLRRLLCGAMQIVLASGVLELMSLSFKTVGYSGKWTFQNKLGFMV